MLVRYYYAIQDNCRSKLEARVQFLVQDRIFLFQISQLAYRGHSSENQIFNHKYCYKLLTEGVCPVFKVAANPHREALEGCHCELSCGRENVILKISTVVWDDYENHAAVISLHKMGKLTSKIFTTSKKLKMSKMFVYRTIKLLMETGTVVDHMQQGCPCSSRTKRLVQTVKSYEKQSVIAQDLNISKMSMPSVLRNDLGLKVYQQITGHFLTLRPKEQKAIKSKYLLQRYTDNSQQRISFHIWKYL